jgi:Skp family chaperone for outer membrane proteins
MVFLAIFVALSTDAPLRSQTGVTPTTSTARAEMAVISFSAAVLGTAEAQHDLDSLRNKYAPRQQQLQKLNDSVQALRKMLADPATKLTDGERSQKEIELQNQEKRLQRDADDFRNDSEAESQQTFQRVAQKVYVFLQSFARQHSYAAVLDRGPDGSPEVLYAAANVDITEQIVQGYNQQSGKSMLPEKPSPPRSSEHPPER